VPVQTVQAIRGSLILVSPYSETQVNLQLTYGLPPQPVQVVILNPWGCCR
jgi:hypothetical protein